MNRRVILWRHGRTEWNVAGRVQGQSDIPLDEVGVAQAKVAGARLASLKPDRILSSDLQRAAATAAELGAACGVQPELDSRFRELNFGAREGLTWAEAWAEFPTEMQAWVDGHEQAMPGAETYEQAGARFDQALRSELPTLASGQTLVIVAHGAILRTGMNTFMGVPRKTWNIFGGLSNCHWAVLEEWAHEDKAVWRLVEWNTGTLPAPVLSDDDEASPPFER